MQLALFLRIQTWTWNRDFVAFSVDSILSVDRVPHEFVFVTHFGESGESPQVGVVHSVLTVKRSSFFSVGGPQRWRISWVRVAGVAGTCARSTFLGRLGFVT